jgi:hypothetical protein
MGEVVDGEGELESILALLALSGDYARVVDEHVEAVALREDLLGHPSHLVQRG